MAATKENPIIFYDLVGANGTSFSLNPYKTRLSLNHKGLPYRIEYLAFPDIEPRLKQLGVTPVSDTHPRYTLPVIADPSSNPNGKPTYISDSFQIALYLDEKYPAPKYPAIFPPGTRSLQHLIMYQYFPTIGACIGPIFLPKMPRLLDARSVEYLKGTMGGLLEPLPDDVATKKWEEARQKFIAFTKSVAINDGTKDGGPFIMGNTVTFLDFVIGGMFHWVKNIEGEDSVHLKEMLEWEGGRWDKHRQAIQEIENKSSQLE
ncbi:glutathione transferase, putative [Rhizoctonia solani AG-3 Rhs1AP]|uniref:Glutathione S-transferase, amino-terminal domain protein n=2 Tax=Rhizoctonia solani AG-3 TaxID=1086053 RepID=A0A074RX87_9AGAM|nr:glutathione transferase, putative [Rhizoctonia solani AG-3 Rhs1AP]KEP49930.1 glutathione S-transferase, amino-terminal domain protein [Rhizoctonia solani 123E]